MPRVWNSVELTWRPLALSEYATDGAPARVARSWSALWIAGSGARLHHHADRRVGQLRREIRLRTARFLEAGQRVPRP